MRPNKPARRRRARLSHRDCGACSTRRAPDSRASRRAPEACSTFLSLDMADPPSDAGIDNTRKNIGK